MQPLAWTDEEGLVLGVDDVQKVLDPDGEETVDWIIDKFGSSRRCALHDGMDSLDSPKRPLSCECVERQARLSHETSQPYMV